MTEAGDAPPDHVLQGVKIDPLNAPFWEAFVTMSQSRSISFSAPNPISLQDLDAYFSIYDIKEIELRDFMVQVIRLVDQHFLKRENERIAAENDKRAKGNHDGRNFKAKR